MPLRFPTIDSLLLAMSSGVIPESVQVAPIEAAFGDAEVWVNATGQLSRQVIGELKSIGIENTRKQPPGPWQRFHCWMQLVPMERSALESDFAEQVVMFELRDSRHLPELVAEMFRLGNDRQSFRQVAIDVQSRSLLRVHGPPYYSLLRALEGSEDVPVAYVEQAPGWWSQLGYNHPLVGKTLAAGSNLVLMRAPREWTRLDAAPFRDVYDLVDFQLPRSEVTWQEVELTDRICVPLRLSQGSGREPAEMWVLRDNADQQLESLVKASDDQLIRQLSFAVGEQSGSKVVIVRVRPGRSKIPVLVLDGVAFHSVRNLPNLFVPIGHRIHPPLRRDAVAELLASDKSQICWLQPGEGDRFTPETLPDSAFRPLKDWVEYVIDRDHEPILQWTESHQFDFESYVCRDDVTKQRTSKEKAGKPMSEPAAKKKRERPARPKSSRKDRSTDPTAELQPAEVTFELKKRKPDDVERQLRKLEDDFLAMDAGLDSPQRGVMWQEMARLNATLKHRSDATICWSNALWEQRQPDAALVQQWLKCERFGAPSQGRLDDSTTRTSTKTLSDIASEGSLVAAELVAAASGGDGSPSWKGHLGEIASSLQQQEECLPVRTVWMAWQALYQLSGNDVLALARARDRLLERLFQRGMTAEYDLPGFMRARGVGDGDRYRVVRDQILRLKDRIDQWIIEPATGKDPRTRAYADLVIAYALARLGETTESRELVEWAHEALEGEPIHELIRDCYEYRINQVIKGEANPGPLHPELLEQLEIVDRIERYKVDRLRQHSRILEPHERIDPYRRWHNRYADELGRRLASLHDLADRTQLLDQVNSLMNQQAARDVEDQIRVLSAALELAPRLGEAFAKPVIDAVLPILDANEDTIETALLLQRGLYVAAHFGQVEPVQTFVHEIEASLPQLVEEYLTLKVQYQPENKEKIDTIESLFTQSFRGLRKLGMREEIGRLYGGVADLVQEHQADQRKPKDETIGAARPMRLLLCVAGGWFHFGQNERAMEVTHRVKTLLLKGTLPPVEQKSLASAYVNAVSQAPADAALAGIEELFQMNERGTARILPKIEDNMTTSSHFSISQLDLIESAVLALVSEDFSLNAESRRWLDEDEFLVRQRIHEDMKKAMQ